MCLVPIVPRIPQIVGRAPAGANTVWDSQAAFPGRCNASACDPSHLPGSAKAKKTRTAATIEPAAVRHIDWDPVCSVQFDTGSTRQLFSVA